MKNSKLISSLTTGTESVFQIKNQLVSGLADPELEYESRDFVALLLDESKADMAYFQGLFEDNFFDEDITKEARRDLVDLNLNTETQLIYDAGFGFIDVEIDPAYTYTYQVISGQNSNPIYAETLDFDASTFKVIDCPSLSAKWNNRQANLQWKTKDHNKEYYGYQVLFRQMEHHLALWMTSSSIHEIRQWKHSSTTWNEALFWKTMTNNIVFEFMAWIILENGVNVIPKWKVRETLELD